MDRTESQSGVTGFQPLYKQVYRVLVERIASGHWQPAQALPSEHSLASELGVSQGTVRKALDAMAVEKLVERRQGRGTFVAQQTPESALFRFFRLARPDGGRVTPSSADERIRRRVARPAERSKLGLAKGDRVCEIVRTRLVDEVPAVIEHIVVPVDLFSDIDTHTPLPNTLYALYQSAYGVSVVSAHEQLTASLATEEDCKRLPLEQGQPILNIDRIAVGLDGRHVEWRLSRCDTANLVFAVTIG